jgi:hypothetical protein
MAQENVEFYKCDELKNTNVVSDNGIIINVNGGVYIGNETNEPTLIANKVEKVSDIENDLNYLNEETVKTINGISLAGQGDIKIPDMSKKIFIGTLSEYNIAKESGKIDVGALVIILEEGENSNDSIALLGTAILGKMLLGQK